MIDEHDNPRPDIAPPTWPQLDNFNKPALPVLAEFVHGCSQDPNKRTLAVTVFVASVCQLAGRRMMGRIPSTIVVNAHDLVPDPIDLLAGFLIPSPSEPLSGRCTHGAFLGGTAQDAPWCMAQAIDMKNKLAAMTPQNADQHQSWTDRYFAAQAAGFGAGPSRGYADAWHETFGLMAGSRGELILRLDSLEDRDRFCEDVLQGAKRLRVPKGYNSELELVPMHTAISGSLPSATWGAPLAASLVGLGVPLMVLPSLAKGLPELPDARLLQFVAHSLGRHLTTPLEEPANLIQDPWFDRYGKELRYRLRHLPDDYEYSMQKLARQLFPASLKIANWCGTFCGADPAAILALTKDLCGHALRGLVLSLAGLAWHGLGIDTCGPREEFLRVLDYLRRKGPMSKSDLLRGAHLQKKQRDQLLECFAAEGLVRVDDKIVTALSYREFVEGLYARKELPHPVNHWAGLGRKGQSAA